MEIQSRKTFIVIKVSFRDTNINIKIWSGGTFIVINLSSWWTIMNIVIRSTFFFASILGMPVYT